MMEALLSFANPCRRNATGDRVSPYLRQMTVGRSVARLSVWQNRKKDPSPPQPPLRSQRRLRFQFGGEGEERNDDAGGLARVQGADTIFADRAHAAAKNRRLSQSS